MFKEDQIKEKLMPPQDMYYTAEESLGLGLCDFVKSLK